MFFEAWQFVVAVIVQWWSVTLAILTALGIVDYFFGWRVGWRKFVHGAFALFLIGAFVAWRHERHARMDAERQVAIRIEWRQRPSDE